MEPVTSTVLIICVRLTRIDDSFQFYEALVSLDLSHNLVSSILDKSFVSQASGCQNILFNEIPTSSLRSDIKCQMCKVTCPPDFLSLYPQLVDIQ